MYLRMDMRLNLVAGSRFLAHALLCHMPAALLPPCISSLGPT